MTQGFTKLHNQLDFKGNRDGKTKQQWRSQMSRTTCPQCKAKLVIRSRVEVSTWERKTGSGGDKQFDHSLAIQMFRDGHSKAAIGREFGVSRERIRQIVEAAYLEREETADAV